MFYLTFEHIGNCFDTAMRMPGKTLFEFGRIVVAKIVHHQKWIAQILFAISKYPMQMDPCPLQCGHGLAF